MTTLSEALAPRSDQLNADDLIAGPRTLKITGVRITRDGRETKIIINYEGDNGKPWKPCKTMGRAMVMVWAVPDTEPDKMVGRSVRVYRDPKVKFGDQGEVGGIRISHMSHIDKPVSIKLTVSQGKKGMFNFAPLPSEVDSKPRQTADQWAAEHIAAVQDAETLDALEALIKRGVGAVGRLNEQNKPLADKVVDAYASRRGQLEREGRADEDHGDQHDDTGPFGDEA